MRKIDFEVIVTRRLRTNLTDWLKESGFEDYEMFLAWAKDHEDEYLFTEQFLFKVKRSFVLNQTIMSGSSFLTAGHVYAPYIPVLPSSEEAVPTEKPQEISPEEEVVEESESVSDDSQPRNKSKKNKNKQVHTDSDEE